MRIEVTQKDIDRAEGFRSKAPDTVHATNSQCGCHCPIALAVKRATHRQCHVSFTTIMADGRKTLTLPDSARNFIKKFDKKAMVKPFTFEAKPCA